MRKSLIALLMAASLGAAATAAILATTARAQAPAPRNPVLLAQNTPQHGGAAPDGVRRAPRPLPGRADRTARRAALCQDMYARIAGHMAYLEARLNLSAAQSGPFARWRDVRLAAAKRRATGCATAPEREDRMQAMTAPNPVDRMARRETRLQRRLSDLQAERPALEALYNSLNAAQKRDFARAAQGGMDGGAMMGPRRRFGFGGDAMFRHGPDRNGPGMRGPGMRDPDGRGPGPDMPGPGMMPQQP